MKVGSKDLCTLTGKYYSLSSLMKAASYNAGAVNRLFDFVEQNLVRHVGMRPPADSKAKNRAIVDAIYDLEAPHHIRTSKAGHQQQSELLRDLLELIDLDCGSWHDKR